jgi:hypothetical protein
MTAREMRERDTNMHTPLTQGVTQEMGDQFWWKGRAHHQDVHERINARHYPGTRQLCSVCEQPTGRCEDDTLSVGDGGPLCEECWAEIPEDAKDG